MRQKFSILFTCFILLLSSAGKSQGIDTLMEQLEQQYPQEKIYVHSDRPFYNPGETIFFKAYLMSGSQLSGISNNMYAELWDDQGNLLSRLTLPVLQSSAAGSFAIPDSLPGNTVFLRAYTPWMLNFDSAFVFTKSFSIIQARDEVKKVPPKTYDLHLFPEGGDLVNGISSKLGFMAVDSKGEPFTVEGTIVDSKKQKVTSFTSAHDGMGVCTLFPEAGQQYTALWKDPAGKQQQTKLSAVKEQGVTLSVENDGYSVQYTLKRSKEIPVAMEDLQVVAHINQRLIYLARIKFSNRDSITADLPITGVEDGIVQVTVIDAARNPLAERIFFNNQRSYYFISDIHLAKKDLSPKAENQLQIDVGDTILTNLSVSVTDVSATPDPASSNIFSGILLTSDLKGYIKDPAYYFSNNTDSVRRHLDLVMLTHGWRRFSWEKVLAGEFPQIKYLPQPYITVTGKVFGPRDGQLTGQELTGILETGKDNKQFVSLPLDNSASFQLGGMIFYDTARLYYQFNNDKNKVLTSISTFQFRNNLSEFDTTVLSQQKAPPPGPLPDALALKRNRDLTQARQEDFAEGRKFKVLEGVAVTSDKKTKAEVMDDEYTSGLFSGGDAYTFITEDDPFATGARTVLEYLQGKVAGLQISTSGFGSASMSWRGQTPSLYLNEMQSDVSQVQSMSISDIAMVKVFRPPFMGGFNGAGGAIAIYTKKGSSQNDATGLPSYKIPGYTVVKEFYNPKYEDEGERNKPDFRTTLYWAPYVLFDARTRRVTLPFYNNDSAKKIRVVIEGVDQNGKLCHEEKIIE